MKIRFATAIAATLFAGALAIAGDGSWTGYIADAKCGVKGANDKPGTVACTKKCLDAGEKMVVVTDGDQKLLTVDNPEALKDHIAHHVAVTGHVKADSIHVDSVKML